MANIKFKVINSPDGLRVRSGAGTSYPKVGVPNLKNGSSHTASESKLANGETWLKVSSGWCCQKQGSNVYAQIESSGGSSSSIVDTNDGVSMKEEIKNPTSPDTISKGGGVSNDYYNKVGGRKDAIEAAIDGSMRMFGLPHQFGPTVDARISKKSKLGRAFSETLVMEAPIVYIKPGTSKFLPNMSDSEKREFVTTLKNLDGGDDDKKRILSEVIGTKEDPVKYFEFKPVFSDYMSRVNMLCRLMAVFLGIEKDKVPWVKSGVTFGTYDWRFYRFDSLYEDNEPKFNDKYKSSPKQDIGAFFKDTMESLFMDDHEYLQLYVDAGASFSESASNSTRSSMIEGAVEQIEGITKELQTLSGISGLNISDLATDTASDIDAFVENWDKNNDSAIAKVFKRFTGNTKQIIAGGNMLLPEVWDSSEFSKSYSFTVHLTTPYGNKRSWFLNIGVPLMHILALVLPHQLSANVNKMPYLVKMFSPGWFSCENGIVDNISIEKGGSGDAWALGGFATEYKINISVKDLYSELGLPASYKPNAILNNTGLLEYLMVTCGMDLTHPGLTDKIKLISNLFKGTINETIVATPYEKYLQFKGIGRKYLGITNK